MFCYGDRYVSMPLHVPLSPPVRWGRSCSWRRYPKRELRRWSRQRSVRSARCGRHFHWENALRRWYGRSILLCSEACWSGSAGRHSPFQCPAPSAPRCRMFSKTLRADSTIPCDCSFLTLLKNCQFIIGNSSAGIREASIYGIPAIDIGSRQQGRYCLNKSKNIQHVNFNQREILQAIKNCPRHRYASKIFGDGHSAEKFLKILNSHDFWNRSIQKHLTY